MALPVAGDHAVGLHGGPDAAMAQNVAGEDASTRCRRCGLSKPCAKPLKLLQEKWHGLECPYCYGGRYVEGDVKQQSLIRRALAETWVVAKLVRKKAKRPKGKMLSVRPEVLRDNPLACAAFAGQLHRTATALQEAGLVDQLAPLRSYMAALGLSD